MKKSTKILFRVTAIISIIISVIFMLYGIALMFNIGGIKDIYIDIIQKVGKITDPSEIKFEVYLAIGDALISVLLNSYCAGVYFKLSRAKSILIGGSRVALYLGILQCLFLISFVPGVMAIVGSTILRKEEQTIINRPREEQNSDMNNISAKISEMRQQKEKGLITQEQYDRFLNDTMDQIAKLNIEKGVKIVEKDSLQERLIQLKQEKNLNNDDDKKDV